MQEDGNRPWAVAVQRKAEIPDLITLGPVRDDRERPFEPLEEVLGRPTVTPDAAPADRSNRGILEKPRPRPFCLVQVHPHDRERGALYGLLDGRGIARPGVHENALRPVGSIGEGLHQLSVTLGELASQGDTEVIRPLVTPALEPVPIDEHPWRIEYRDQIIVHRSSLRSSVPSTTPSVS
jgi:hypothetical protein